MHIIPFDGKPIAQAGLYSGVSMDRYHGQLTAGASASRSSLWKIVDQSLAHYWVESYLNPHRVEAEESDALVLGRAAHHLLLGEADFAKHFAVRPHKWDSWRTNDAKSWRAQQQLDGLTVVEPKHIEIVRGMADSLAREPLVRAGILNGLIEHTIVHRDEETGIWLKVRPDAIPNDSADFSDLKTCADVTDEGIESSIGEYGYHMQGAMVGMACRAVLGREMTSFSLVFVEKKPPHCARIVTLKPADLELGEKQVRMALRLFRRALDTNHWPGPGGHQTDAAYVEMKPWHRSRAEHRLAVLEQELAA